MLPATLIGRKLKKLVASGADPRHLYVGVDARGSEGLGLSLALEATVCEGAAPLGIPPLALPPRGDVAVDLAERSIPGHTDRLHRLLRSRPRDRPSWSEALAGSDARIRRSEWSFRALLSAVRVTGSTTALPVAVAPPSSPLEWM